MCPEQIPKELQTLQDLLLSYTYREVLKAGFAETKEVADCIDDGQPGC